MPATHSYDGVMNLSVQGRKKMDQAEKLLLVDKAA